MASHWDGTRNGTIVHWPNGVEARGEVRHPFHHVVDVVRLDIGTDSHDHLIDPAQLLHFAMSRQ